MFSNRRKGNKLVNKKNKTCWACINASKDSLKKINREGKRREQDLPTNLFKSVFKLAHDV